MPVSVITPVALFTVSRINDYTYDENSAVLLALSELTSASSVFIVKNIVKRDRPFIKLKNVKHNTDDESFLDTYSFPSGHSSMAFSFATSLTLRYPGKPFLIAGLYSYAVLVSIGRIYLGNHYPSDVLGGMILGSGSAVLIYSLRSEIISMKNGLFREENRPDSNNSNYFTPLVFGSLVISDVINNFLLGGNEKINLNLLNTGNSNYLILNCNF
jgi:undecaprenyl-diphosphatase